MYIMIYVMMAGSERSQVSKQLVRESSRTRAVCDRSMGVTLFGFVSWIWKGFLLSQYLSG